MLLLAFAPGMARCITLSIVMLIFAFCDIIQEAKDDLVDF